MVLQTVPKSKSKVSVKNPSPSLFLLASVDVLFFHVLASVNAVIKCVTHSTVVLPYSVIKDFSV